MFLLLCSDLLDLIRVLCIEEHDLLAKMLFNITADAHRLLGVNEIDGDSVSAKATCAADSMQVSLAIGLALLINRQVEVDDDVHLINVNSSRQDVSCDENFLVTFTETIQDCQSLINSEIS